MNKISNILIFVVITSARGITLNDSFLRFEQIAKHAESFGNLEITERLKQVDNDCIREHLKLDKFGEKCITEMEQDILYKYSAIVCHEDTLNELFSFTCNINDGKFDFKSNLELINCFKSKLFELEPTSKLIVESDYEAIQTCNTNFINLLPNQLRNEYVNYNAAVTNLSCGKVTPNEFTIMFIKLFLIDLADLDENLKKSETKEIKEMENTFTKYAYDCIIKRLEDEDNNKV